MARYLASWFASMATSKTKPEISYWFHPPYIPLGKDIFIRSIICPVFLFRTSESITPKQDPRSITRGWIYSTRFTFSQAHRMVLDTITLTLTHRIPTMAVAPKLTSFCFRSWRIASPTRPRRLFGGVAVQRESPKPDTRHEASKTHDFVACNSYRPSTLFLSPASSRLI